MTRVMIKLGFVGKWLSSLKNSDNELSNDLEELRIKISSVMKKTQN